MATITTNGIRIGYETEGDANGPAVLLIMGLGMQLIDWPDDFVAGLAEQGYRVIRFDNRDSGLSSKLDEHGVPNLALAFLKRWAGWPLQSPYSLDDMADDALGLLNALHVGRAHVVGASMGGMIAQLLAARHPRRVASLTSIMSSSGRRGLPGPARAVRRALWRASVRPRERTQLVAQLLDAARLIGSPAYPTPEPQLRQRIEAALRRSLCPAGVARQMMAIAAAADRGALLETIRCPSMVIHGAADPLLPPACGIDTARRIPGASLHLIEGMGHDLPPQLIERLLALIDVHLHGKMAALPAADAAPGRHNAS